MKTIYWVLALVLFNGFLQAAEIKTSKKNAVAAAKTAESVKKVDSSKVLKAEILDKNTESPLFRFTRTDTSSATEPTELNKIERSFVSTDGTPVANEDVFYSSGKLKKIIFKQHQLNEEGELEVKDNKVIFKYTRDGKTKTNEEDFDPTLTAVDQIFPCLNKNWADLMNGKTISIRLPVLDRAETVGFKFFKEKDTKFKDKDVTVIKMKPSSFIIAAIVDPLLFYFDKTDKPNGEKKLIQVVGRTVPKVKEGSKWKDLDAILRFE